MSPLYSPPGSAISAWARGLAWLWALGEVSAVPGAGLVGVGSEAEAGELIRMTSAGELAGAVIAVRGPGPAQPPLPARRRAVGIAEFDRGTKVEGEFTVFDGRDAAVESSLGTHAVEADGALLLGHDPERDWGRLDSFWAYEAIAAFLRDRLPGGISPLPPVGALRLDDIPGIALHQLQDRAKGDRRQTMRIRRTARRLRAAGAVLNVAVCAEALDDERRRVPLDRVWPRSVAALREGIEGGAYEPVCHGLLHLDTEALARGEIEFREFATLDAAEAGRRLDLALAWQERHL
ncbi:MAG: hypothetical protein ACHQJ5_00210, partial [Vicinamibacteria bacterium]